MCVKPGTKCRWHGGEKSKKPAQKKQQQQQHAGGTFAIPYVRVDPDTNKREKWTVIIFEGKRFNLVHKGVSWSFSGIRTLHKMSPFSVPKDQKDTVVDIKGDVLQVHYVPFEKMMRDYPTGR